MGEPSTEPGGQDPDAPWRRGFDGWDATDATSPVATAAPAGRTTAAGDEPSRSRRRRANRPRPVETRTTDRTGGGRGRRLAVPVVVALVALVALVVVVVVGVIVVVTRGDDGADASSAPALPTGVDEGWQRAFDRVVDGVAVSDDVVVVGASGGLTVLDLADGSQRWSLPELLGGRDIDIERLAVLDERILVQMAGASGSDVRVFELATGAPVWESDAAGGSFLILNATDRPTVVRRIRVEGRNTVQPVDPSTGSLLGEPIGLSSVTAIGRDLGVEPADRSVAVWSTDRREIIAGPVDSFDLRAVAALDGSIVALDLDGRIAAFDGDGVRVDARVLAGSSNDADGLRPELLGVAGSSSTVVVGSDPSIGFTVEDEEIVIQWQRDGRMSQLVDADVGPVGLLVEPTSSVAGGTVVVDADTGDTVAVPAAGRERVPVLARNGYLLAPDVAAPNRSLEAVDFEDRLLWSLPIGSDAEYELFDGAVVVLEPYLDGTLLTVAR